MTEDQEQMLFVQWWRRNREERIFAIPNGSLRHPAVAMKLKCGGVSAGVPDLFVPALHLWIEMKKQQGGRLSPVQKDWIAYLTSIGDTVIVGFGWEDAVAKLQILGFVPTK